MIRCRVTTYIADYRVRCVLPEGHPPVTDTKQHAGEDYDRKAVYFGLAQHDVSAA